MNRQLGPKFFAVAVLAILLLIPLYLITETISGRAQRRDAVREDIARHDVREQLLVGPVLALPYTVHSLAADASPTAAPQRGVRYVLPATLDINGQVDSDIRERGLFKAMTYNGHLTLTGAFEPPASLAPALAPGQSVVWGQPQLLVGLSDNRGLRSTPSLTWNQQPVALKPGQPVPTLGAGVHADLPALVPSMRHLAFELALDLRGNTTLSWVPLGESTRVHLTSRWPHPGFSGAGLPSSRSVSSKGFEAQWDSSALATDIEQQFAAAVRNEADLNRLAQGVRLVQPVDNYLQTERAVKYGFLFVLLTFGAFALFELLKDLRIHPVQYALVGLALALFFLLLLALSEHLGFGLSYLAASAACVSLLAVYLRHVLQSTTRGLGFAGLLSVLYGAMYVLLSSEDFALLLGSLLLFGLLALVMLLTRKVDWYALQREPADRRPTVGEMAARA